MATKRATPAPSVTAGWKPASVTMAPDAALPFRVTVIVTEPVPALAAQRWTRMNSPVR